MYFSKETLATNSRLGGHWSELWANRNMWNLQNDSIIAAIGCRNKRRRGG